MRKFVPVLVAVFVMALVAPALAAPAPKATGGAGWANVDRGFTVHASFNAHGGLVPKGNVNVFTSDGSVDYKGDVTCYMEDGNQAAFSGPITQGGGGFTWFIIWVEDNGEGANASGPDMIQTSRRNSDPGCNTQEPVQEVEMGNIQVH